MSRDTLTAKHWATIFQQKGFGNPIGQFWFLGMEEGGDGAYHKLLRRAKFRPIEDLSFAQSRIGVDMATAKTGTWPIMTTIVRSFKGENNWTNAWLTREYQVNRLGRLDGDTFLAEIFPLPSPSRSAVDWNYTYELLLGKPRDQFEAEILPIRLAMLHDLLATYGHKKIVICYGGGDFRQYYPLLFPAVSFVPVGDGVMLLGKSGSTCIVLTPFFGYKTFEHKRISSLVKILKENF